MSPPQIANPDRRDLRQQPESPDPGPGRSRHPNPSPDLRELPPPAPTCHLLRPAPDWKLGAPLVVMLGPRTPASVERWSHRLVESLACSGIGALALQPSPHCRRAERVNELMDALAFGAEGAGRLGLLATGTWCTAALRAAALDPSVVAVVLVNPSAEIRRIHASGLRASVLVVQDVGIGFGDAVFEAMDELPESACLSLQRPAKPSEWIGGVTHWLQAQLNDAHAAAASDH